MTEAKSSNLVVELREDDRVSMQHTAWLEERAAKEIELLRAELSKIRDKSTDHNTAIGIASYALGTISQVETAADQKHYPEEWGPSDARQLTCVCGDPDPGHMTRPAPETAAVTSMDHGGGPFDQDGNEGPNKPSEKTGGEQS